MKGRINSIQSLGTVDGPGIRFVVFAQGCPLRCACCHNPETWSAAGGTEYSAEELLKRILNYREYFGEQGGVTASGGEPLLQAEFFTELFNLCISNHISTCLDTSGFLLDDNVKALLEATNTVLLDVKYSTDDDYEKHVGMPRQSALDFLEYLCEKSIPTVLRRVIIGGINDTADAIADLKQLKEKYPNVYKIELLPFRKLCAPKYEAANIPFPFADRPEPSVATMEMLNKIIQ